MREFNVHVSRDAKAKLWFVESSDIPGLNVEADSLEALVDIVMDAAPDLIDVNVDHDAGDMPDIPLNIIQHAVVSRRPHHA